MISKLKFVLRYQMLCTIEAENAKCRFGDSQLITRK